MKTCYWTKDAPKESGYYWLVSPYSIAPPEIVLIKPGARDEPSWTFRRLDSEAAIYTCPSRCWKYWTHGPIQLPEFWSINE